MSRQNLTQKALRTPNPHRAPSFFPRKRQIRRPPPPYSNLPPVFAPLVPIRIGSNVYPGRPRTALEITQPSNIFPYFPSNTVFVFHPPRQNWRAPQKVTSSEPRYDTRDAMTSHVEIITTPTADTPGACLYVHFDKRRYLFGSLAEGVQRAFNQRKMPASSLEQIFVSGEIGWSTVGGMMGLLITVADVMAGGKEALAEINKERREKGRKDIVKDAPDRLDIHGAENLTYTLATARNFIFRTGMPFRTFELATDRRLADPSDTKPDWEDDCIKVWKVPLVKQAPSKKRRHDDEDNDTDMGADPPAHKRQKSEDQRVLSDLVQSMFNSEWRMDALVPSKLLDVRLPATVFVRGEDHSIQRYRGPLPGDGGDVPNIDVLVREPWPATKVHTLPQTQTSSQSMSYIVKNHARRGKFKADVARKLGVEPVNNKRLVAGETVETKDGTVVTPDMVLEPPTKANGFAVADICNESYMASFLSRPEWTNEEIMDGVGVMYWILGKGMVARPEIQAFIKDRPQLKHVMLAPDACPNMIAFESHACLLGRLQRIDPDRFPTLSFNNTVPDLKMPEASSLLTGRTGNRIKTMPQLQVQDDGIVPFCDPGRAAQSMRSNILNLAAKASKKISDPKFLSWIEEDEKDIPNRDTEITPLGTGSALPSKYRNVSSTLIRVPQYGSYLLDCGENTLGQMRRSHGYDGAEKILSELRCIFISHMHADHHLGTMSVIDAWQKATAGTGSVLSISCTDYMRRFIEEYSQVQAVDFARIRFYGDSHSDSNYGHQFEDGDPSGLSELVRIRVDHCKSAHAGILTWPSGLKIAYSGDCRPSSTFAAKAKGATLLIHEATFDDEMKGDAVAKKHCTVSEALGVAEKMGARRVLLTHFSQRYAKLVSEDEKAAVEEGRPPEDRVVLNAFDQMRVKLGEFRKAEAFLPAIRKLLEDTR